MAFQVFKKRVTYRLRCERCGTETLHEKIGTDHDVHWLVEFFTMLLWTPFMLASFLAEALAPVRCTICRTSASSASVRAEVHRNRAA